MKRIFVTGANGFIGRHLINALNRKELKIFIPKRNIDLRKIEDWNTFEESDVLIHLAAKTSVEDSWEDPKDYINTNTLITTNVLEYCRKYKSKLILLSSYLYGNPKTLPINENFETIALNPYALSKLLSEEICKFYKDYFGIETIIFRVFNIYGPFQPKSFLISKIIKQVEDLKTIKVNCLNPKRDYLYIDDLIDAIQKAIYYKGNKYLFNIGFGKSHSVKEIISIIQKIYNTNLPVVDLKLKRKIEINDTVADIKLSNLELGWKPKYDIEKGIMNLRNLDTNF